MIAGQTWSLLCPFSIGFCNLLIQLNLNHVRIQMLVSAESARRMLANRPFNAFSTCLAPEHNHVPITTIGRKKRRNRLLSVCRPSTFGGYPLAQSLLCWVTKLGETVSKLR